MLKSNPQLLLIGIDLAANRALVLSGRPISVATADDLVHLIESRVLESTGLSPETGGSEGLSPEAGGG